MPLAKPPKPAKIRGTNATITLVRQDFGNLSASGMPYPSTGSTELLIPCTIEALSPGEAFKYGHAVNETVYRLLTNVRAPDGSDIVLKHNQYIIVTSHPSIAASTEMQINGAGKPEGDSGWQTAILKVEDK